MRCIMKKFNEYLSEQQLTPNDADLDSKNAAALVQQAQIHHDKRLSGTRPAEIVKGLWELDRFLHDQDADYNPAASSSLLTQIKNFRQIVSDAASLIAGGISGFDPEATHP